MFFGGIGDRSLLPMIPMKLVLQQGVDPISESLTTDLNEDFLRFTHRYGFHVKNHDEGFSV